MSKQNRRSISVRAITYQRLHDFCEAHGKSVSGYIEELIAEHMDAVNVPVPTVVDSPRRREEPEEPRKTKGELDEIIEQHFTF